MTDELIQLVDLFRLNGGIFENAAVGHRQESGYYCSVIDKQQGATVHCPAHLLVDVDDIGINENGLYISKPENYSDSIVFLDRYFKFFYGKNLVNNILDEKRQIDLVTKQERALLNKINLPGAIDSIDASPDYARKRILASHMIDAESHDKDCIMPFVSLLNHSQSGIPYHINANGISLSGRFDDEIFAFYNVGDVLQLLESYSFVTDTTFIYSLPMTLKYPDGTTIKIDRDTDKFNVIDDKHRWPVVENKDGILTVSWFPLHYKLRPRYPARFSAFIASELKIPAEQILHSVFLYNLDALLPVVFELKDSTNSYIQMVVSAVERQLQLIGKIQQ